MKKIILAAFVAGMFTATLTFAQAPAGDAAKGKVLFAKDGCYECHGTVGQGGTGPRIAPRTGSIAYIRKPAAQMPPYTAKVLPDSDVADLLAYLMTIPAPPPAKSIALLN
jgi:ubiquinol-cytochrome c reductase cytochrome c subunit